MSAHLYTGHRDPQTSEPFEQAARLIERGQSYDEATQAAGVTKQHRAFLFRNICGNRPDRAFFWELERNGMIDEMATHLRSAAALMLTGGGNANPSGQ